MDVESDIELVDLADSDGEPDNGEISAETATALLDVSVGSTQVQHVLFSP